VLKWETFRSLLLVGFVMIAKLYKVMAQRVQLVEAVTNVLYSCSLCELHLISVPCPVPYGFH